ncbi:MAG: Rrf2 family transcriptional regulator, partial [Desulfovibrionaceae bacterium]
MKLTTRSRYGTLIVLDIAQHEQSGPVRTLDIALRKNISMKYMEKITSDLRMGGILLARRGPGGGHMLTKSPEMIAVGDVVRILDWQDPDEECLGKKEDCRRFS